MSTDTYNKYVSTQLYVLTHVTYICLLRVHMYKCSFPHNNVHNACVSAQTWTNTSVHLYKCTQAYTEIKSIYLFAHKCLHNFVYIDISIPKCPPLFVYTLHAYQYVHQTYNHTDIPNNPTHIFTKIPLAQYKHVHRDTNTSTQIKPNKYACTKYKHTKIYADIFTIFYGKLHAKYPPSTQENCCIKFKK